MRQRVDSYRLCQFSYAVRSGCAVDLQMRVCAPTTGRELPIILLSHGLGNSNNLSSLNGYRALANFWAAHGFVVIQPTHLDSKTLSLDPDGPEGPLFWRSRVEDMKRILDQFDLIEASVPETAGAWTAAGHSTSHYCGRSRQFIRCAGIATYGQSQI